MQNWIARQRVAFVVGLTALGVALVLFVTPVGSAPSSGPESTQQFCGRVVKMEFDSGDCGSKLASRRTAAWTVLIGGLILGTGGVWALRPDS